MITLGLFEFHFESGLTQPNNESSNPKTKVRANPITKPLECRCWITLTILYSNNI